MSVEGVEYFTVAGSLITRDCQRLYFEIYTVALSVSEESLFQFYFNRKCNNNENIIRQNFKEYSVVDAIYSLNSASSTYSLYEI